MNEKEIEVIVNKVMKKIKEDTKEVVKKRVLEELPLLKDEVEKETLSEITKGMPLDQAEEKRPKVNWSNSIIAAILSYLLYIAIGIVCLVGIERILFFIVQNIEVSDRVKEWLMTATVLFFIFVYIRVGLNLYKLKYNKNTSYIYGIFEIGLGIFIVVVAGLDFLSDVSKAPAEVFGIDIKIYVYFYGGLYVMVRGFESINRYFDSVKKSPKFLFMDMSKERIVERFFNKMFEADESIYSHVKKILINLVTKLKMKFKTKSR
ncbi:hypothetical protein ACQKFK_26770 [Bacillus mycoides]|uniref:hypothetical protein n=1 Tax=Bacillus mycoides TaxID=1405 RepID=UPI003D00375E